MTLSVLLEVVRRVDYLLRKRVLLRPPEAVDAKGAIGLPVRARWRIDVNLGRLGGISGLRSLDHDLVEGAMRPAERSGKADKTAPHERLKLRKRVPHQAHLGQPPGSDDTVV